MQGYEPQWLHRPELQIVSQDQWDRANALRSANSQVPNGAIGSEYAFSLLLRCVGCGSTMTSTCKKQGDKRHKQYRCEAGSCSGTAVCQQRQHLFESVVARALLPLAAELIERGLNLRAAMRQAAQEMSHKTGQVLEQTWRAELAEAERQIQNLAGAIAKGVISDGMARTTSRELAERKSKLERDLIKVKEKAQVQRELLDAIQVIEGDVEHALWLLLENQPKTLDRTPRPIFQQKSIVIEAWGPSSRRQSKVASYELTERFADVFGVSMDQGKEYHTHPELVDRRVQAGVVGLDQRLPHGTRTSGGRVLPGQVVGGKSQVHLAFGGGKHASKVGDVKSGHPLHDRVRQLGVEHEIQEQALEPAHVPRRLEQVAVGHHEAALATGVGGGDAGREREIIVPRRVGPCMAFQIAGRLDVSQRISDDLVIAARAIAHRRPAHAPDIHAGGQRRADVGRGHLPDVENRIQIAVHAHTPRALQVFLQRAAGGGLIPAQTMAIGTRSVALCSRARRTRSRLDRVLWDMWVPLRAPRWQGRRYLTLKASRTICSLKKPLASPSAA